MDQLEKSVLDAVTMDEPWGLVESFAGFNREHPTDVNRGMDEVASRLRRHGVKVTMHQPDLYLSLPGKARIEAGGKTFAAKTPAYSISTPDGLTGELIYIPAPTSANPEDDDAFESNIPRTDALTAEVTGKIVLSEGLAGPGLVSLFEDSGAIAVIGINPGVDIHSGICTPIWGVPGTDDLPRKPKIPAAAVNNPDGKALIEIAKAGGELTIFTETEEGWYKSNLPEVFIKGTDDSDKYILLHGHLDSWHVGVGDNATGDAAMLEIARVLWANRDKLKRSVRIAWWPGHSTGRYAGSTWFADKFALDLDANCVAQVNCDSPGCRWATEFIDVSAMTETESFLSDIVMEVADKTLQSERPHRAGDYSFNGIGISGYFMLSSAMPDDLRREKGYYRVGGCGMNIAWHTENDTLEIADKDILYRDIKVYLLAILRNSNATILPFDWRATAREFLTTIDNYQAKAGELFDLSPSRTAVEALLATLETFYANVENNTISPDNANTVIQDLARILVPINFNYGPRFQHDPALTIPPLPALEQAGNIAKYKGDEIGFAVTQLVRGQNKVIAALHQAQRHISLVID
ncbi:MAG: M28 family peptidase [Rhodobacteraceae bacterium]|nr:M28 family peptidase [Paracoccaceae bacterium]